MALEDVLGQIRRGAGFFIDLFREEEPQPE